MVAMVPGSALARRHLPPSAWYPRRVFPVWRPWGSLAVLVAVVASGGACRPRTVVREAPRYYGSTCVSLLTALERGANQGARWPAGSYDAMNPWELTGRVAGGEF